MKIYILIICAMLVLSYKKAQCQQQTNSYQSAAQLYREYAAKTKCPERARYLIKMAEWNECMVDVLAGRKTGCGLAPSGDAPACPADNGSSTTNKSDSSPQNISGSNSNEDLDNSVKSLVEGISQLSEIKLDENAKTNSWFLISAGSNLSGGGSGPIYGTRSDIGSFSGYFISFQGLERKGLSFSSNVNNIKATYSHRFRAKNTAGEYNYYYGKTSIDMTSVDVNFGKDLTGPEGSFHFVPNIGANLIFNIDNSFVSNDGRTTYEEEFNKDIFFSLNTGVQMFWMFSKRFGLQGGGRYVFFPSQYGTVFKTNDFFHFNIGLAIRII